MELTPNVKIDAEALWGEVGYEPHERQLLYHRSKQRFKVAACGRRFGKSKMASMDKLPKLFVPKMKGWVVGESYTNAEDEMTYFLDALSILQRKYGIKFKWAMNTRTGEMYIEMPWGARAEGKSANHRQGLVGKGLGWVIMSEAAKQQRVVWEKDITPALADFRAPADFPSTPEGDNWFKDIFDLGQDPAHRIENGCPWEDSYESWQFAAWDNPIIYPGSFEDPEIQRQMKTPEGTAIFWQELGASFKAMVGRIYPEFDKKIHVKKLTYNPELKNLNAFDFGFTDPFVCLDIQLDEEGNWYVWREYYYPEMSIARHVSALKSRYNPEGYHIDLAFGDAADPSAIEDLNSFYCRTIADPEAKKDFRAAVNEIQGLLMGMDKKPHLFVDPSCVNFIKEMEGYKWPKKRDEDANTNEKPPNALDHTMDALRYAVMHLKILGYGNHLTAEYTNIKANAVPLQRLEQDIRPSPRSIFALTDRTM